MKKMKHIKNIKTYIKKKKKLSINGNKKDIKKLFKKNII